jgi:hypothetical protein
MQGLGVQGRGWVMGECPIINRTRWMLLFSELLTFPIGGLLTMYVSIL